MATDLRVRSAAGVRPSGSKRPALLVLVCAILLVGVGMLSLMTGNGRIDPLASTLEGLLGHGTDVINATIQDVRLPRLIGAFVIGAALAVAGAIIQGVTRNPIAEPGILGINSGAALAVVIVQFGFGIQSFMVLGVNLVPLVALLGALAAVVAIFCRRGWRRRDTRPNCVGRHHSRAAV